MKQSINYTARKSPKHRIVAPVLLAGVLTFVSVQYAVSDQDKMPVGSNLPITPITMTLQKGVGVTAGGSGIKAIHYDASARWDLAKQFLLEPRTFADSRLLLLFDLDEVTGELLESLMKEGVLSIPDSKNVVWQGHFLVEVPPFGKKESVYFGTTFMMTFETGDKGKIKKKITNIISDQLKELALESLNNAAPKGSTEFGKDSKIFLAVYDAPKNIKSMGIALTYAPPSKFYGKARR